MIKASEKASKILIRDFGELENLQVSKKVLKILSLTLISRLKKLLLKSSKKHDQTIQ